jgi:hypothetical protein
MKYLAIAFVLASSAAYADVTVRLTTDQQTWAFEALRQYMGLSVCPLQCAARAAGVMDAIAKGVADPAPEAKPKAEEKPKDD